MMKLQNSPATTIFSQPGQGMLVIIDSNISDSHILTQGVITGADVLHLHPQQDGIAQITQHLQQNQGYHSLHLITHGQPESFSLGTTKLTQDNLMHYAWALQQWSVKEILLYGCQVAKDAQGKQFVKTLGQITRAKIAASTTKIGHEKLGGNWQLDYNPDQLNSPLAFKRATQAAYFGVFPTFTANNVTELISHINTANSTAEADTINLAAGTTFNLTEQYSGDGNTFYGPTGLPFISSDIVINGNGATIQRASTAPNFRIFLISGVGGPVAPNGTSKLTLDNVTVKGGRAVDVGGASDDGGGIFNLGGELIVRNNSVITENYADDDGGGIANVGTIQSVAKTTIDNSTLSNNTAKGVDIGDGGGAIDNDGNKDSGAAGAEMTITNSTLTGNSSTNGVGGGIKNQNGAALDIQGSQITNNSAPQGSGIATGGLPTDGTKLSLTNTQVTGNSGGIDIEREGDTDVTNGGGNTVENTNIPELENVDPTIVVTANGDTIADGTGSTDAVNVGSGAFQETFTPTTFTIKNVGQNALSLGSITLVGGDSTRFTLDTSGLNTNLAQNTETTFTVNVNNDQVGGFDSEIQFTANDPNITDPFNFAITGTVTSPLVVQQVDENDQVLQTIADGTTQAISLGNVVVGNTTQSTLFKVENKGSQTLTLGVPTVNNNSAFTLNTSGFDTELSAGESTTFSLELNSSQAGTFTDTVEFTTPSNVLENAPFDFAIEGVVSEDNQGGTGGTGGTGGQDTPLLYDAQLNLFTMGAGKQNLSFQLVGENVSQITQIAIAFQQSNGTIGQGRNLLSLLPPRFRPQGFGLDQQSLTLENVTANQKFVIELRQLDGTLLSQEATVTQESEGVFQLSFAQGITLKMSQTNISAPLGVGNDQKQDLELFDLEDITGTVQGSFTLYREAQFSNVVGLYQVDDVDGTVNGLTPGQSGYAEAAITNRVTNVNLSVGNQSVGNQNAALQGGGLYAPFIITNGTIEQFLADNPGNALQDTLQAYFIFSSANPDNVDHIRLLGNNTIGFEDLSGGGDFDFNDVIVDATFTV